MSTSNKGDGSDHGLGVTGGMTPAEVVDTIRIQGIRMIDIRFTDMFGQWEHFTVPAYSRFCS